MASKRKFENSDKNPLPLKKHTLDSDEEDSDEYEKDELNYSDIEGAEDGIAGIQDEVKITPFNMKEELQEGHFDKEGHYHWNKNSEIKDNWLDNIDWMKIKQNKTNIESNEINKIFNPAEAYSKLLEYMDVNETIQQTLQRLGKNKKSKTTAERFRLKRMGIIDDSSEKITKLTEIVNNILTNTGNMNIYEESYSQIKSKAMTSSGGSTSISDMYSDDFEEKEQVKMHLHKQENLTKSEKNTIVYWEFKFNLSDTKVNGPYSTEQILKMKEQKKFGDVYIRKVGESTNFYSFSRIDFELYIN